MLLITPHAFRHIGLVFLAVGVTAHTLPHAFADSAAYGDFITALLAILSLIALRKIWTIALPLTWIFNIVGTLDLLIAIFLGARLDIFNNLGAAWYLPTFIVPALLVTHYMIFVRLLKPRSVEINDT